MEKDDIVKYWIESSDSIFRSWKVCLKMGITPGPLFLGHLVVEKNY